MQLSELQEVFYVDVVIYIKDWLLIFEYYSLDLHYRDNCHIILFISIVFAIKFTNS